MDSNSQNSSTIYQDDPLIKDSIEELKKEIATDTEFDY
jgi:hypothetical protein